MTSRALQAYLGWLNNRGGEADVRLEFCVACGSKDGLQHGYLVTKAKGGSDAEANRITLCTSCNDKHEQRYGASKHSKRIKTALAARRARGASIGRPKKLLPDDCKEALRRLMVASPRPLWRGAMASASLRLVAWCTPHASC